MTYSYLPKTGLILIFLLSLNIVACQEEKEPITNTPATPSSTLSTVPPTSSDMENAGTEADPRLLEGEVVAIEGMTYTIQVRGGDKHTVEATSSTLVDEALTKGDKIEIRFSQDQQPIAIRKVRTPSSSERVSAIPPSSPERTMLRGQLTRIDKEQSHYVIATQEGQKKTVTINSNTLIDASTQVGDQVEIRLAMDNRDQAIAIRKVRP